MNSWGAPKKKNPSQMISPSVKNRMWALIIHPDSERIDPQRWQSLDSWDWRLGELLMYTHSVETYAHFSI